MGRALAILLALVLSLATLAAALYLLGTSDGVMLRLMQTYAPPEATGLPEGEYPAMTEMICTYMRGDRDTFQLTYTMNGAEISAFNVREQQHMEDVQGLFGLCRRVLWGSVAVAAALAAAMVMLKTRTFRKAFRWGLIGVLASLAILAIAAMADFDSLFILFHKVAFVNDLWLLNPRTDMLIRLMPTEFFVAYVWMIGGTWLGTLLVLLAATFLPVRKKNEGDENP